MKIRITPTTFVVIACLAMLAAVPVRLPAATVTVTSTADNGPGSLRAALAGATDGDTINFSITGTILLTGGELLVTRSVTITGPDAGSLAVDGNATSRVFHIAPSNVVTIVNLIVANGYTAGDTFAAILGGGIYNDHATLTVSNCVVTRNSASWGSGIFNHASAGSSSSLKIVNTTLSGNSASAHGGGIYSFGAFARASLEIANSTVRGNSAVADGGGIVNRSYNGDASLSLTESTVSDNHTGFGDGGGIWNSNDGSSGTANVEIAGSTLSFNSGGLGGGILNRAGGLTLANSTLSGNSASLGGGIANEFASLTILNSTLSGNTADFSGGGIWNYLFRSFDATVQIGSSILNASHSGANIVDAAEPTIISLGYNLSDDDGGGALTNASDQINTDPLLGPLLDNGGPTFTHALAVCSPAIDHGRNLATSANDQRGMPRTFDYPGIASAPGGDGTDIGAFEAHDVPNKAAAQQITDLIVLVESFNLKPATANSLIVKLQDAVSLLNKGNLAGACGKLQDFLNLVTAQAEKKQITASQADRLTCNATRIRAVIGCK